MRAIDSFKQEFNSKLELLAEVDRDTLYFDGFDDISKEIKKIREKNPAFRIVVFVDDLDRCSPTKTLEVLESIKVFLGMEGFVYIIGLSQDIVTKLIDIAYKETGVSRKKEQVVVYSSTMQFGSLPNTLSAPLTIRSSSLASKQRSIPSPLQGP